MSEQRVTVEHDDADDIDLCYDDGSMPIIELGYGTHYRNPARQLTELTSFVVHPRLVEAFARWGYGTGAFTRYARIFHGTTVLAFRDTSQDSVAVALDTAAWRDFVGFTEDAPPNYESASFGDYGHWLDGDVYVGLLQEKCDHDEWHTIDAIGGLFGEEDDALEQARDHFGIDLTVSEEAS